MRLTLSDDHHARQAAFYAAARRDLIDALPSEPTAAILDLACGAGATGAWALKERKCATYIGIEANPAAGAEAAFALTDVHIGELASLDLPYPAKTFDAVLAGAALDGLDDPAAVLARLVPLLRPGARVFATVTARHDWRAVIKRARLRLERPPARTLGERLKRWFTRPRLTGEITASKPWG